jgi:predicted RNase H-like nuclease
MRPVLGIDAAWTDKNPSGVALVGTGGAGRKLIRVAPSFEDFVLGATPQVWGHRHDFRASLADVLGTAEKIANGAVSVIAVDMPVGREPVRRRRLCDQMISSRFGARGCATHTPTETRPGGVSDRFLREAQEAAFTLVTTPQQEPRRALLEVYPHVALLALCNAERRLPYKLSRRAKNFGQIDDPKARLEAVRNEWNRILARLKREIDIDLDVGGNIATLGGWKAWEDVIDAIVCAWVGLEWAAGRTTAFGDELAAIWVPERSQLGG